MKHSFKILLLSLAVATGSSQMQATPAMFDTIKSYVLIPAAITVLSTIVVKLISTKATDPQANISYVEFLATREVILLTGLVGLGAYDALPNNLGKALICATLSLVN